MKKFLCLMSVVTIMSVAFCVQASGEELTPLDAAKFMKDYARKALEYYMPLMDEDDVYLDRCLDYYELYLLSDIIYNAESSNPFIGDEFSELMRSINVDMIKELEKCRQQYREGEMKREVFVEYLKRIVTAALEGEK